MNDKELLELAAKAAGIEYQRVYKIAIGWVRYPKWNPLTDDGDALRLAVKLGIYVTNRGAFLTENDDVFEYIPPEKEPDSYAATRLAIVRAAAEIGLGIAQPETTSGLPDDDYYQTMAEAHELGNIK